MPRKSLTGSSFRHFCVCFLYELPLRSNKNLILDDETNLKSDFKTLPGPQFDIKFEEDTLLEAETPIGIMKFGEIRRSRGRC